MSIATYTPVNDLIAPVTTGGIQSFIDVYGDMWVAKPGVNGGAWRKARDVLHAVIYRNAAWSSGSTIVVAFDTVLRDTYGMFSSNGYLIPVAGWYRIQGTCNGNVTAVSQYMIAYIYGGPSAGTQLSSANVTDPLTGGGCACRTWADTYCNAGDLIQLRMYQAGYPINAQVGQANTRLEISFTGTG
jgi:hypothetical protein